MRIATAQEVAELLLIRIETVYELAQKDELPQLRSIGPRLRFDLDEVEEWMRQRDGVKR